MKTKRLLCPQRLRRVPHQFSWIDQRLVREGHIARCGGAQALALYLLLVTVADSQGLSYYSDKTAARLLSLRTEPRDGRGEVSGMRRFLLLLLPALLQAAGLQIYAIDVEGGKSTLYVSPSGQSMLVDAGYDGIGGRDAKRIAEAARAAGVRQIDYLVVTHYHHDHVAACRNWRRGFPSAISSTTGGISKTSRTTAQSTTPT